MEQLKKRHREEIEKYNSYNKDCQKYLEIKKQLGAQLNEELKLLHDDHTVYKAIVPVLVKQDLKDAKDTVTKRRNFINEQTKRNDDLLKDLDTKRQIHENTIKKTENQIQQLQLKSASAASPNVPVGGEPVGSSTAQA